MKFKHGIAVILLGTLTGCAELTALNQQIESWAGEQIKIRDADKQVFTDTVTSRRDIDSLYVRIKRSFHFETVEEALGGCSSKFDKQCSWREMAIRDGGYIHEKTPGVHYRMARTYTNERNAKEPFFLDMTLEKNGKNTDIYYKVRGNQEFADTVKTLLRDAIK